MAKLKKIKLNRIKTFFNKIPRLAAERALLSFLILFLISLILGGLIFYQYNILIKKKEAGSIESPLPRRFDEKTYESVLKTWQEREKIFKETETKKYFNIFRQIENKEEPIIKQPAGKQALIKEISEPEKAFTIFEFYRAKGESMPLIQERAQIWEKMGLGQAGNYQGWTFQNIKLLAALKKELQK